MNKPMTQGVWHNGKGKIGKLNFVGGALKRIMIDVGGGLDRCFPSNINHTLITFMHLINQHPD